MSGKRCVNSGPDSYGVLDGVRTDRPGFSLCAAPLELVLDFKMGGLAG